MSKSLEQAVAHFETKAAFARAIGETPQTVSNWFSRGVPANKAKAIEHATGGKVSCSDLLPAFTPPNNSTLQKSKAEHK